MLDYNTGWPFFLLILLKLLVFVIILVNIYYFRPIWLIQAWKWYQKWQAGLKRHCLKITEDLHISYLERKGPPNSHILLFVHGFTGDKHIFCDTVRYLPSKFHVILIDLPGHGESKPDDNKSDYRPSVLVDSVHQFVKANGFGDRKLTIIGQSMGGAIAGVYAARYGDQSLSSVVLVCPAGIHSPVISEFLQKSANNHMNDGEENILIPRTVQEFHEMLHLVMHHKIHLPSHVAMVFLKERQMKADTHKKVLTDMNVDGEYLLLDKSLEEIRHPVLCVWGKHDKVLDVSGSDVIKERVKNVEVHTLERCGHLILLDRPRKLIKIITQFLEKVESST